MCTKKIPTRDYINKSSFKIQQLTFTVTSSPCALYEDDEKSGERRFL